MSRKLETHWIFFLQNNKCCYLFVTQDLFIRVIDRKFNLMFFDSVFNFRLFCPSDVCNFQYLWYFCSVGNYELVFIGKWSNPSLLVTNFESQCLNNDNIRFNILIQSQYPNRGSKLTSTLFVVLMIGLCNLTTQQSEWLSCLNNRILKTLSIIIHIISLRFKHTLILIQL